MGLQKKIASIALRLCAYQALVHFSIMNIGGRSTLPYLLTEHLIVLLPRSTPTSSQWHPESFPIVLSIYVKSASVRVRDRIMARRVTSREVSMVHVAELFGTMPRTARPSFMKP